MHDLQYGPNSADGIVDGDSADELCGQVGVENQLYLLGAVKLSKSAFEKEHLRKQRTGKLINYSAFCINV